MSENLTGKENYRLAAAAMDAKQKVQDHYVLAVVVGSMVALFVQLLSSWVVLTFFAYSLGTLTVLKKANVVEILLKLAIILICTLVGFAAEVVLGGAFIGFVMALVLELIVIEGH